MTTAKNAVFIVLLLGNCCLVGVVGFWWRGDKNLVEGEGSMAGGFF